MPACQGRWRVRSQARSLARSPARSQAPSPCRCPPAASRAARPRPPWPPGAWASAPPRAAPGALQRRPPGQVPLTCTCFTWPAWDASSAPFASRCHGFCSTLSCNRRPAAHTALSSTAHGFLLDMACLRCAIEPIYFNILWLGLQQMPVQAPCSAHYCVKHRDAHLARMICLEGCCNGCQQR